MQRSTAYGQRRTLCNALGAVDPAARARTRLNSSIFVPLGQALVNEARDLASLLLHRPTRAVLSSRNCDRANPECSWKTRQLADCLDRRNWRA